MEKRSKRIIIIVIEIFVLFLFTAVISYFRLDLLFQDMLFKNGFWIYAKQQPWQFLYHYGTIPGIILASLALFSFIFSYSVKNLVRFRRIALFIFLTLIIGPGLIVNATFKDRWGRPRPRNVEQFGGKMEFREIWEPGTPGRGKSFPCGHCSMGFYLIVLSYFYLNRNRKIAYAITGFSLIYGTLIGISRMTQGGHFASDVVWAGGFTILTAQLLYYVILKMPKNISASHDPQTGTQQTNKRKIIITSVFAVAATAILIYIYLFSKPVYKKYNHQLPDNLNFSVIQLNMHNDAGNIYLQIETIQKPITLSTQINGFGLPNRKIRSQFTYQITGDTLKINSQLSIKGKFNELESESIVTLNGNYPLIIAIETDDGNIFYKNNLQNQTHKITLDLRTPEGKVLPDK